MFNRTGGYKGYVFPAVAVIIVQQTLLFGAATFMGGRRRSGAWRMGVAEFWGTLAAFTSVGSGLVDYSQKMTVAARAMAEKKAVGQRS